MTISRPVRQDAQDLRLFWHDWGRSSLVYAVNCDGATCRHRRDRPCVASAEYRRATRQAPAALHRIVNDSASTVEKPGSRRVTRVPSTSSLSSGQRTVTSSVRMAITSQMMGCRLLVIVT